MGTVVRNVAALGAGLLAAALVLLVPASASADATVDPPPGGRTQVYGFPGIITGHGKEAGTVIEVWDVSRDEEVFCFPPPALEHTGDWQCQLTGPLAPGTYDLEVRVLDANRAPLGDPIPWKFDITTVLAVDPASLKIRPGKPVRITGVADANVDVSAAITKVGDRTFRIADVAEVKRGFNDPPAPRMRFMGEDAIGIAVSMKAGGDILVLGKALEGEFARLQQTLPLGMELRKVSDQPAAVKTGVGEFVKVLVEALVIVLAVSFFSLGVRTGLVVALVIPLVLAMTFAAMYYLGIGLHKISLGASLAIRRLPSPPSNARCCLSRKRALGHAP